LLLVWAHWAAGVAVRTIPTTGGAVVATVATTAGVVAGCISIKPRIPATPEAAAAIPTSFSGICASPAALAPLLAPVMAECSKAKKYAFMVLSSDYF
jgi:hypothetical protein